MNGLQTWKENYLVNDLAAVFDGYFTEKKKEAALIMKASENIEGRFTTRFWIYAYLYWQLFLN